MLQSNPHKATLAALRVAAYTGGSTVPSARFRVRQYIPALRQSGVYIDEFVPKIGTYPPKSKVLRPFWAIGSICERLPAIARSYRYNLTLLQREILSTLLTLEPLTRPPRVLDVDDAIWLNHGGNFANRLAALCDLVICGNNFLAEYFYQWNPRVSVLPTAIDTERFYPLPLRPDPQRPIIVWSGISNGLKYLYDIEPALKAVLCKHRDAILRVISDQAPRFTALSPSQWEFLAWSPVTEVVGIQSATVGMMPLRDDLWERGKCSVKMLSYMACGISVVVSPVGMNAEVLKMGPCGFGTRTLDEWVDALDWLLTNTDKAVSIGGEGRKIVLDKYSLHVLAPQLAQILRKASETN